MQRFAFRLQPVLGHRQRLEEAQQVVFAAAKAQLQFAEAQRDDYVKRRAEMRDRLHDHHAEMNGIELQATYAHCDFLDRAIVKQEAVVAEARANLERERRKLVAKTQDKKVLEVLKERRREAFESEQSAIEQAESDEMNARRYHRTATPQENAR